MCKFTINATSISSEPIHGFIALGFREAIPIRLRLKLPCRSPLKIKHVRGTGYTSVIGLTEDQKKKYRLLDNKTSEYASWDYVALMEEMNGLDWEGLELDWGLEMLDESEEEDYDDRDSGSGEKEKDEFEYECPECGFKFNA